MPWSWSPGLDSLTEGTDTIQRQAQALMDRARPQLVGPQDFEGLFDGPPPTTRPDILVIVIESLRHDALDPRTMPNLWAASERGVRFESHYATSNASHYGMFALLYGRSPLLYFETLEAGERPTLPSGLREWGYSTHHLTCSDIRWRRMDRFLGSEDFEVERLPGGSLDACDRNLVGRAGVLLTPGERPPRFVLGFMMSTHFGYHFPEDSERFVPSADPPNALLLNEERDAASLLNRYRNSAHHVDAMIGTLLERIDLDDTLVVVTGDHGESIFDDGTIAHASRLSEIQTPRSPRDLRGGCSAGILTAGPDGSFGPPPDDPGTHGHRQGSSAFASRAGSGNRTRVALRRPGARQGSARRTRSNRPRLARRALLVPSRHAIGRTLLPRTAAPGRQAVARAAFGRIRRAGNRLARAIPRDTHTSAPVGPCIRIQTFDRPVETDLVARKRRRSEDRERGARS